MARHVAYLSSALALAFGESSAADWPLAAALAEDDLCGRHAGTSTCALELAQLRSSWSLPRRRREDHAVPFSDAFGAELPASLDGEVPGGSLQARQVHHHHQAEKEERHDRLQDDNEKKAFAAKLAAKHQGGEHHGVPRDALGNEVSQEFLASDDRTRGPGSVEKRMEEQAKRDEEKWAQQDANGRAAKVSCGGDAFVKSCDLCPRDQGAKWCHGECMWLDEACVERTVSCGGESRVKTCAQCPRGHYAHWCNGDCVWKNETATCGDPLDGVGEPPSLQRAREATEEEEAERALEASDAERTTAARITTTETTTTTYQASGAAHVERHQAPTTTISQASEATEVEDDLEAR